MLRCERIKFRKNYLDILNELIIVEYFDYCEEKVVDLLLILKNL